MKNIINDSRLHNAAFASIIGTATLMLFLYGVGAIVGASLNIGDWGTIGSIGYEGLVLLGTVAPIISTAAFLSYED